MDRFCIITNSVKDEGFCITKKIARYLKEHGKQCTVENIQENTDCIIVLGGDGTLLQAAREVVDKQIPLLGINLGNLGYLAEIDSDSIEQALNHLMLDEYEIENRMMLNGRVFHQETVIAEDIALNDIVISRDGPLRMIRFSNYVNNAFLNDYTADGIIIATPTGSTGYSLSVGGPIISPGAYMMMMTPIAPHTLNTRSVIFGAEDEIIVIIAEGKAKGEAKATAVFDGVINIPMVTGDRIVIQKAPLDTQIVKISNISFLEVLRKKMRG